MHDDNDGRMLSADRCVGPSAPNARTKNLLQAWKWAARKLDALYSWGRRLSQRQQKRLFRRTDRTSDHHLIFLADGRLSSGWPRGRKT